MAIDWEGFLKKVDSFNESDFGKMAPGLVGAVAPLITQGNSTALGNAGMGIGALVGTVDPLLGTAITGISALGNAAFGSNINQNAVNAYNSKIVDYSRPILNATDNSSLMNQLSNLRGLGINKEDLGTQGWFSHKLDDKYNRLQQDLNAARASRAKLIDDTISNVNKMNKARVEANYYPFGGPMFGYMDDGAIGYDMMRDKLNIELTKLANKTTPNSFDRGGNLFSTDYDLGLSFLNTGGTHGENPYGGIPIGMAQDGNPNLGEEGEVIFNDFVFSNRLKVPKAIRNKYKLRKPFSYAEALKDYIKRNGVDERENDPIMKNGLMAFASDLALTQEMSKANKKDTGHKFATGGPYIGYNRDIDPVPMETEGSDYMTALHWLARPENVSYLRQLQSDITNGLYDDANGPNKINGVKINDSNWWRLATDGKVGPVHNAFMKWANENRNLWGTPVVETPAVDPGATAAAAKAAANEAAMERAVAAVRPIQPGNGTLLEDPTLVTRSTTTTTDPAKNAARFSDGLRMAGLFANTAGLAYNLFDPYEPERLDVVEPFVPISGTPIGDYVPELHLDTNYAANQAAQQAAATRNAIMNTTNPNRNAGLLAADYNAQLTHGDLLRDAQIAEHEGKIKARTFNRETNKYNSTMDLDVAKANMAGRQAYDRAKLQQEQYNISNYDAFKRGRDAAIGNSITAIGDWFNSFGKERYNRAMVTALLDSGALATKDAMRLFLGV